ncbi:MAG: hypothetical protein JWR69_4042 [Pedosphaera sp.]|nr:hypothetical protein [Pedosphaera sp.]
MSNASVRLEYDLTAGATDFYWNNSKKISGFYAGVVFDTGYLKGINYSSWSYAVLGSNEVVITAVGSGLPVMKQYFTLDLPDSFLTSVQVVGVNLKANWMGPVVVDAVGAVDLGVTNDNRALYVPFDNDHFTTYNAMPMNSSSTSYEVGAFYDNTTRNGLVVGSVTHDTWKSGIYFYGTGNKLNQMNVFGGAASPWDVSAHGFVAGNTLSSPTMFVGFGIDWRTTMETFAAENAKFTPKLPWTNGVPFGWNSWGVIQASINYTDAIAVSDYFYANLEGNNFVNHGTVYINLDSFWDNMNGSQLQSFVNHCHTYGQKAGIYLGPFAWFGSAAGATNSFVEGTGNVYRYSDILLKDANGNYESNDGALALDPTHPGTQQRMYYYVNQFTNYGFDYVKLDFLSHGALEGVHHDPNVTTGIQAYNQGMQTIFNQINGRMFISESIAPLFPYQYAHSRRIACDAQTSRIGDTQYTMNSVSYGWWLDGLYEFNDPDSMVFGNGADTNENQSRLISGAVTGIFLDGDDLTSATGRNAAQACLTKSAINAVARVGKTFRPVEGNPGNAAANVFVRQDGTNWCLAVFNYTSSSKTQAVDLSRAGLPPGSYLATNLWDGTTIVATGSLPVSLNARQSKLFRLLLRPPENLQWNTNNTGVWDAGVSSNWLDRGSHNRGVFFTGDQVLFDDTLGVPTGVTVNGTVSPSLITINSSSNNFTITGAGKISGAASLLKSGSSTLKMQTTNDFTGSLTIDGGTVQMDEPLSGTATSLGAANAAPIYVTNGATLAVNATGGFPAGNTGIGLRPVVISGTGVGGNGALRSIGNDLYYGYAQAITLAGNATIGGVGRWDLGGNGYPTVISTGGSNYNLTCLQGNYSEWHEVTLDRNLGNIDYILASGNTWAVYGMGATGFGNPTNTITLHPGVNLTIWHEGAGGDNGYAKIIHVETNAQFSYRPAGGAGDYHIDTVLQLDAGAGWNFYNADGGNGGGTTVGGTVTLSGPTYLSTGNSTTTFTNLISGPGGFVWQTYDHSVVFTADNTYAGPTILCTGRTLVLTGNGAISHSSLIFFGGNDSTSAHLDVSGRLDQTLTLTSGQTLAGIGRINGGLSVTSGAILSPGGTNTTLGITAGANRTGLLTVTNDIALHGTTVIKLNGSGTNDAIQSTGAGITYGGTLSLVNISDSPLVAGDTFQIFGAVAYSGSFTDVTPATPGTGLTWDTTQLNSGKLSVKLRGPSPMIGSVKLAGGKLVLNGSNGAPLAGYYVLTTTNLNTPLVNWVVLTTNAFDGAGAFTFTNLISPLKPRQFYLIQPY